MLITDTLKAMCCWGFWVNALWRPNPQNLFFLQFWILYKILLWLPDLNISATSVYLLVNFRRLNDILFNESFYAAGKVKPLEYFAVWDCSRCSCTMSRLSGSFLSLGFCVTQSLCNYRWVLNVTMRINQVQFQTNTNWKVPHLFVGRKLPIYCQQL